MDLGGSCFLLVGRVLGMRGTSLSLFQLIFGWEKREGKGEKCQKAVTPSPNKAGEDSATSDLRSHGFT